MGRGVLRPNIFCGEVEWVDGESSGDCVGEKRRQDAGATVARRFGMGEAGSKPRDLGSDRGYRVARVYLYGILGDVVEFGASTLPS
jgi:hypothetical protein